MRVLSGVVGRVSVGSIGCGCMGSRSYLSGGGGRREGGLSCLNVYVMSFVLKVLLLRGCVGKLFALLVVVVLVLGLLWWLKVVML